MRFILSLLFLALSSGAAMADDAAALPCPQCGTWQILGSGGTSGESIVVAPDRVEIPSMGNYCAQTVSTASVPSRDGGRDDRIVIRLSCSDDEDDALLLEMAVRRTPYEDGGTAGISVHRSASAVPVLTATGWHLERADPCTGDGNGVIACAKLYLALSYKRLALVAYEVQRSLPARQANGFARRFSPARFAIDVAAFCDKYGTHDASGGAWRIAWSSACQNRRLAAKVHELEAWRACTQAKKAPCTMPGQQFDRTVNDEAD
jgi:hypothetical protein